MDEFQPITCKEFNEAFNAISDYHACSAPDYWKTIEVAIRDPYGELMAVIYDDDRTWHFDASAFDPKELFLMARLAATSPELRAGGNNDD